MKKLSFIMAVVMLLCMTAIPAFGGSAPDSRADVPASPAGITRTLAEPPAFLYDLADDIMPPELTVPFPSDYFSISGEEVSFYTSEEYAFEPSNYYGLKVANANNTGAANTDAALGVTLHMYPGDAIDFYYRLNRGTVNDCLCLFVNGELKHTINASAAYFTHYATPLFTAEEEGDYTICFIYHRSDGDADSLSGEYCMLRSFNLIRAEQPDPTATPTPTPTPTPDPEPVIGDVNCDGVVTASDISALFAYVMNAGSLSAEALRNADVNGDGTVDSTDASLLAQMVFGS